MLPISVGMISNQHYPALYLWKLKHKTNATDSIDITARWQDSQVTFRLCHPTRRHDIQHNDTRT
jgi:hypothetical protein